MKDQEIVLPPNTNMRDTKGKQTPDVDLNVTIDHGIVLVVYRYLLCIFPYDSMLREIQTYIFHTNF